MIPAVRRRVHHAPKPAPVPAVDRQARRKRETREKLIDVSTNSAQVLSRDNAKDQFETLEKLFKVAGVVQALKLPGTQLAWLFRENGWLKQAPDPLANSIPLASWFSLIQLQRLRRDLAASGYSAAAARGGWEFWQRNPL